MQELGKTMRNFHALSCAPRRAFFRIAIIFALSCVVGACATYQQYAAHGYLTPGPTGNPELIGVFDNYIACEEAAQDWASRQVVGNPVFAECLPVDRN